MAAQRHRTVAGISLVGAGAVAILGIVTAETLVPGYSTSARTISALGGTRGTGASRAVFNSAMVGSGALTLIAAHGLHRADGRALLSGVIAAAGGGLVGVGLFPAQTGAPHFVAAVVTFVGIGLAALVAATAVSGAFRYVSVALGGLELLAFGLFISLGGATPVGVGGLERWAAYLGLVWATAFGGFLLAGDANRA